MPLKRVLTDVEQSARARKEEHLERTRNRDQRRVSSVKTSCRGCGVVRKPGPLDQEPGHELCHFANAAYQSARNAESGSTRVARRAGKKVAAAPASMTSAATPPKTPASVGLTSNSNFDAA